MSSKTELGSNSRAFLKFLDEQTMEQNETIVQMVSRVLKGTTVRRSRPAGSKAKIKSQWHETMEELEQAEREAGERLCRYKGVKGKPSNKYCGATAINPEVEDVNMLRCNTCSKKGQTKRASKEDKPATKNVSKPSMITTSSENRMYVPPDKNVVYEKIKIKPVHYKIAKTQQLQGFVFDTSKDKHVCVGKLNPSMDPSDVEGENITKHIVPLQKSETNCLKPFGLTYSDKKQISISDDEDSDSDSEPVAVSLSKITIPADSDSDSDDEPAPKKKPSRAVVPDSDSDDEPIPKKKPSRTVVPSDSEDSESDASDSD